MFVVVDDGQESADFGEGERDETSMNGWCSGRVVGRVVGRV